jgi:hypothetical protein
MIPWIADLFFEWSRWLSAPSVFELEFPDLSISHFTSLAIPPPDGPPWHC